VSKIKGGNSDQPKAAPADPAAPAEIEFELSLEDTLSQQRRGVSPQGNKGPVVGYNPYDTPVDAKKPVADPDAKRKPTDLRKLSEWIRLQRQVQALKKDGPPEPESE
jgi:hypothetical protein